MNIKKGDVLKHKKWNETAEVLAVAEGIYFMLYEKGINVCTYYTLERLKETFGIPEEKWVPSLDEVYYTIMISGGSADIISSTWQNSPIDNKRQINNLVFQSKEAAEAKLSEILNILNK